MNPESFLYWFGLVSPEIHQVEQLLKEKLSDNPHVLYDQIAEIESWQGRMSTSLADAEKWLDQAEADNLPPKQEKYTDQDRKVLLRALVKTERMIRNKIEYLLKCIERRLFTAANLRKHNISESNSYPPTETRGVDSSWNTI